MSKIQVGDKVRYNIGLGRGVAMVKEVRDDGMATLKTANGRFVERKASQLEIVQEDTEPETQPNHSGE